jgi:Na+/melibiose symporter-like transporter
MSSRLVPLRTKLLYGSGEICLAAKNAVLNQFLLFFYVDVVHLGPALVSGAIFVGKIWDGIIDPAIGYVSDNTTSRWGRRRPWVALSAVPVGVLFYLLFAPPLWTGAALIVYVCVVYLGLMTAFSTLATPYFAWGAEITEDYHERTTVVQIRTLFGVLGGLIGAVAPVAIARRFVDQRVGYAVMAALLAVILTVTALIPAIYVRERNLLSGAVPSFAHFASGLRKTFANRDFRVVFVTFCLMTMAASLGQSVQLFVIKYWLQMYDFFPMIAFTFALSFAASFPVWLGLSRRVGKRRAMLFGLSLGCLAPLGWILMQPGNHGRMLLFMVVAGCLTGSLTLVMSSAIDIVDFDEWETGERREGAYFGIWTLGLKTMGALGTLMGGAILDVIGFEPEKVPSEATVWWLIVIVGPVQALSHFFGLLVMRRFRFDAHDVTQVQEALALRRAGAQRQDE